MTWTCLFSSCVRDHGSCTHTYRLYKCVNDANALEEIVYHKNDSNADESSWNDEISHPSKHLTNCVVGYKCYFGAKPIPGGFSRIFLFSALHEWEAVLPCQCSTIFSNLSVQTDPFIPFWSCKVLAVESWIQILKPLDYSLSMHMFRTN